ncbi:MAG: hypothetical protein ACK4WJ_02700, partial [Endomicrobiia bacterium]
VISNLNLDNTTSGELVLVNNNGIQVNKIVYPVHNTDVSYSRITDGNAQYFEFDPSPTKGLKNATTEYPQIKINEVHYSSTEQFIELFNTSYISTITFSGYLRNTNNKVFKFTRKLYPRSFAIIDFSSVDNDGFSFYDRFGTNGLNTTSDFVVLETTSGRIIDRITYQQSTNYVYRNEQAQLVSYTEAQQGGVANTDSLSRFPDGKDSGINNLDFVVREKSYGMRNVVAILQNNVIYYPLDDIVLPRRFKIELKLSTDCSKGYNNTLWFIRTSGAEDRFSPHIYRLSDLGFDLSSLLVQTTIYTAVEDMIDIDGHKLSTSTVYKIILNTENDVGVSSQVVINNVFYDTAVHTIKISTINYTYANEGKYYPLMKLKLKNESYQQSNKIALDKIFINFTNSDDQPLNTQQIKDLFDEICLFKDTDGDEEFFASFDNVEIAKLYKENFNLVGGTQEIVVNATEEVLAQSYTTYYLTVKLSSYSSEVPYRDFKVKVAKENIIWVEVISSVEQPKIETGFVITSSASIVRPLKPPKGTNWPFDLNKKVVINNNIIFDNNIFVFCEDGTVVSLSSSGVLTKTFQANSSAISPIVSLYFTGEDGYLYFGTKNGSIYKNLISDISQNVWVRNLSDKLSSEVVAYYYESPAKIYAGTIDGYVYKISTGAADFWTPPIQLYGAVVKSPAIDEGYTEQSSSQTGVSSLWWGTSTGYVYRLALKDGYILASTQVVSAITTSIEYDAGFENSAINSLNIYFGTENGYLYCRYGLNLSSIPANWYDLNLGSRINTLSLSKDKKLYVGCDKGVYKIDATNAQIEWFFATDGKVVSYLDVWKNPGYVYFNTDNGFLYCIDTTGKIRNNYPIILDAKSNGNFYYENKKLTIGTNDGKIYMFEE